MTTNALTIFNFMKSHPGEEFTKQDIAAQLSVSVQAVTGTTNSLIKKGYAVEREDAVEIEGKAKVVKYVMLTDAGLEYDPEAEEAAAKEAKEREKAEKARAREEAKAAKKAAAVED